MSSIDDWYRNFDDEQARKKREAEAEEEQRWRKHIEAKLKEKLAEYKSSPPEREYLWVSGVDIVTPTVVWIIRRDYEGDSTICLMQDGRLCYVGVDGYDLGKGKLESYIDLATLARYTLDQLHSSLGGHKSRPNR